jgi:hypothetical protein
MNMKLPVLFVLGFVVSMGFGCSTFVLTQTIPVSTNPIGAKIYANGQYVGQTPTSVSLERNRDHILTLIKEDYQQKDVTIRRVYQRERTLLKAVSAGVETGRFFKDSGMGVSRGISSMSEQEASGEAYLLSPSSVAVSLAPLDGTDLRSGSMKRIDLRDTQQADASVAESDDRRGGAADLAIIGLGVAASQANVEKKWKSSSSSSRTYTSPDGSTQVTKTSKQSTSVGVGVNPIGLVDVLGTLFK